MRSFRNIMKNGRERVEKLPAAVYLVECETDETVLVAMQLEVVRRFSEGKEFISVKWFDAVRERVMRAKLVWRVGECLAFERLEADGGGKYYFTPLTLEKYYSEVKDSLVSGEYFTSEAEMIEAFLKGGGN